MAVRSNSYGSGGYGGYSNSPAPATPGGIMSPTTSSAPGAGSPTAAADYAAQYAQYYGAGQDPYAAYGGYAAYVQYYQQYMAAAAAAQPPPPGGSAPGSAPPPPPSEAPPPPPPSGSAPGTGYNAVSHLRPALPLNLTRIGSTPSRHVMIDASRFFTSYPRFVPAFAWYWGWVGKNRRIPLSCKVFRQHHSVMDEANEFNQSSQLC